MLAVHEIIGEVYFTLTVDERTLFGPVAVQFIFFSENFKVGAKVPRTPVEPALR